MVAKAPPLGVALAGPTGSGKSACALALIERLRPRIPVEIVSVDSAQVYRGMDIGTAKPDQATRTRVPHHLIDICDPAQSFSAGDFVRAADAVIADIHARGALPLLVGGTMLYLRALREGLAAMPRADAGVRAEIEALAEGAGWDAVHAELARVDPQAAARIAPRDAQRLQRALEVYRITDCPISHWHAQARAARPAWRWLNFALWPQSRQALRLHLQLRFEAMLAAGFEHEVRALYERGDLTARHSSMRAVGYRQLWRYCANESTLEQAATQAVTDTMQLAKRQLTWLRREHEFNAVNDLSVGALEALTERISAMACA
jgi:tRNA dimethylallyltransferase